MPAAWAQSAGYFVPPTHKESAPTPEAAHAPKLPAAMTAKPEQQAKPKVPNLPPLPAEAPPPTAVIGVLSVPEVMQKSTAAQGVQKVIQQRQEALSNDAKAARAKIQDEQQAINKERGKLSDSQLEAKEQALRNEIAATQTKFEERNQAIQNAGQAALSQIEGELIAIIRQEATAHGMNLVLHREQVLLDDKAFDITNETVAELNKLLPSVKVPPSVVTPELKQQVQEQEQEQGNGQAAP